MSKNEKYCIVFCTTPNEIFAHSISKNLILEKIAACITILPNATSFYRWNNIIENKKETQIIIKSLLSMKERIFSKILSIHPYKNPELLCLSVTGSRDYLSWIEQSLQ